MADTLAQGVDWVIVADNGSSDETAVLAAAAGAQVVSEPRRGYGYACAAGSAAALALGADVLVYLDGDYSSLPAEMPRLLAPLAAGEADLVARLADAGPYRGRGDAAAPAFRQRTLLAADVRALRRARDRSRPLSRHTRRAAGASWTCAK